MLLTTMSLTRPDSTFCAKQVLNTTISRNLPEALFTALATLQEKKNGDGG
jgi:hypothetical protein